MHEILHFIGHIWQWGDVPGWLEALATVFGFLAVIFQLQKASRDRLSEQAGTIDYVVWAGEKRIYVPRIGPRLTSSSLPEPERTWPRRILGQEADDYAHLLITVYNGSRNAVNDVIVSVPQSKSGSVSFGKVPPGEHTCYFSKLDPDANGAPNVSLSVLVPLMQFRDQNGRLWQRDARGDLKEIRKKRHELPEPRKSAQLGP